jgi:hypothetical protein
MAMSKAKPHRGKAAAPQMAPPKKGVRVRMYRQGLGDCFLLCFPGDDGKGRYVLIDCGVHKSQTNGVARVRAIVKDVAAATGGHLHVVVATHEHTDHLSGFFQEHASFSGDGGIAIDELWLAWTEDPEDEQAARLRRKRGHTLKAIEAALKKLEAGRTGEADRTAAAGLHGLADFFEVSEEMGLAAAAAAVGKDKGKPTGNEVAFAVLRRRARAVRCFNPGARTAVPGVAGVAVYVLGPPRDESLLSQSDPSSGEAKEVYLGAPSLSLAGAFAEAVLDEGGEASEELRELRRPFDGCYRVEWNEAQRGRKTDFFRKHYGFTGEHDPDAPAWRRVDDDWLRGAAELALNLESDTNNTSLALAFELSPSGRVLLFPGDAQVGNWLSWQDLTWKAGGRTVSCDDLLKRTVLYKVGHHASHNGTLKADGLEKMGDDLIALIPVDRAAASKLKGWNMPYPPLYRALLAKTGRRVLRSDQEPELLKKGATKPDGLSRAQWEAFQGTTSDKLYFELTVGG